MSADYATVSVPAETPRYHELRAAIPFDRTDFVLVGSAVLAARGMRDVRDLDVLIKPKLWPEVKRLHAEGHWPSQPYDEPPEGDLYELGKGRQVVRTGWFDFFSDLPRVASCVSFVDAFTYSTLIDGYQVMSLRHCLAIKALANRTKDHEDMMVLASLIYSAESEGSVDW